jgi:hypothetical protein
MSESTSRIDEEELYLKVALAMQPLLSPTGIVGGALRPVENPSPGEPAFTVCAWLYSADTDVSRLPATMTVKLDDGKSITMPVHTEVRGAIHVPNPDVGHSA